MDSIKGQQQTDYSNPWKTPRVPLKPILGKEVQFAFIAFAGYGEQGDIDIYNILIRDSITSIAELKINSSIMLHPNPFNHIIYRP
ncbi:MAG: hypothetical protein CMO34_03090 [Verrucomicrobia bacterium]|nr:hypothetical protein [Verrucomicrobiota bacterium]